MRHKWRLLAQILQKNYVKNVTSPNGTTQAALEVFDRAQISQNIQAALAAAQKRSQELAQELSDKTKSV